MAVRVLINGSPIAAFVSPRWESAQHRQPTAFDDRPEGIARDRWDVAIETVEAGTILVECGAMRERVSQELARKVFDAVKRDLETAMLTRLPFHFGLARAMIDDARQHEQQIGQPVDVREQMRLDAVRRRARRSTLRAAADGPREMQQRAGAIAAGQNEAAQRRQLGLEPIDPVFEALDVGVGDRGLGDALGDLLGRDRRAARRARTDLSAAARAARRRRRRARFARARPEAGVQLVDVAVRGDARIGLRHAVPPNSDVPPASPVRV